MKANHWNRDATEVKQFNKEAMELKKTDMGRYWLFCYEVLKAGSLPGEWKTMKQAGVSFICSELIGMPKAGSKGIWKKRL